MESFIRGVRLLSRLCGYVAAGLIAASVVVVCQMVLVRYVFNENTIWQTDFVTYSLVAATFIGSPYVLMTRGHVNVDVLPLYLGPRNRRTREQNDERGDKDNRALGGRAHATSFGGSPNGHSRPVTNLMISATYCRLRSANPTGIAAYGIHSRARHMDSERQLFSHASYQN